MAKQLVAQELPPLGYKLRSSGSGQTLPKVAWIAILDPDVTLTAKEGLYVVYLYDVNTEYVFLSMNQGATAHQNHYRDNRPVGMGIDRAALEELTAETTAIRERLDPGLLTGTVSTISLGSKLYLPLGYEAGNIAAIPYSLSAFPPEQQLRDDLAHFLILYQESVAARHAAIASRPDVFNVPAPTPPEDSGAGAPFRPKDSNDYFAWIKAHKQRKTRKHEALVGEFGHYAQSQGWRATTKGMHPRDLVLDRGDDHLLIEAKTVRANSAFAVRDAIGQLIAYEYLYYPAKSATKVALFSAPGFSTAPLHVDGVAAMPGSPENIVPICERIPSARR